MHAAELVVPPVFEQCCTGGSQAEFRLGRSKKRSVVVIVSVVMGAPVRCNSLGSMPDRSAGAPGLGT